MRYTVVVEETPTGFSAYAPDLPGCIGSGSTRDEVEAMIREAIELHLDGLREDGHPVPAPHAYATVIEVAA